MVHNLAAAYGSGPMGRTEDHLIAQGEDLQHDSVKDLFCHLLFSGITKKICPRNIPGKERVAAEYQIRGLSALQVTDNKGDTLFGVPGCFEDLNGKEPEGKCIPVMHCIAICKIHCSPVEDLCPAPVCERKGSYDVVLVPVRLKNMRDGTAVPGCSFKVDITVPPGIDDYGFSGITDDIRSMSKTFGEYPFKQHVFSTRVEIHLPLVKRLG